MKNLLRYLFIGLTAAGFMFAAVAVLIFNRPTLGWQALSVPTGSMRPTFSPGALVITHRVPIQSLKIGDIITHTNPLTMRSTLTHRIIKVYKADGKIPTFVTKGDANPSPDPPVVGGLVQGRMVAFIPFAGELLMWAKTWTGVVVLIYVPALLIMIAETRRMAAYLRQIKPYYLEGWQPKRRREQKLRTKPAMAVGVALAVIVAGAGWQTAGALAGPALAGTVSLSPNVLTAETGAVTAPPSTTPASCTNSTSGVRVDNATTQTASTGSAHAHRLRNGSAASGSANNSNNTNVGVNVTGC